MRAPNRTRTGTRTGTRGQPVVALALVMTSWVAARAMLLQADVPADLVPQVDRGSFAQAVPLSPAKAPAASLVSPVDAPEWHPPIAAPATDRPPAAPSFQPPPTAARMAPPPTPPALVPVRTAGGSLSLWMAAVARLPLPPFGDGAAPAPLAAPFPVRSREVTAPGRRWSADGWVMLRRGGNQALGPGPVGSTYGASQAGAVLRYRLAPSSPHRPTAFLRATAALNRSHDREAALGISARPLAGVPVTLAAEARLTDDRSRLQVRPAIAMITELPPFTLPLGIRGEAYLQAGYVAGKGATAFADGQVRADRRVLALGRAELRAGGGAWGGIQDGASRLDVGPSATVGLPLGRDVSARLGLDWRFRVAGTAAPESGPAITLSAGF